MLDVCQLLRLEVVTKRAPNLYKCVSVFSAERARERVSPLNTQYHNVLVSSTRRNDRSIHGTEVFGETMQWYSAGYTAGTNFSRARFVRPFVVGRQVETRLLCIEQAAT